MLKMNKEKKVRSPNFSQTEVSTLIDLMNTRKELRYRVLGGLYKTSNDLVKEWKDVACIVSATGDGHERTYQNVRSKWKQLKFSAKAKQVASEMRHTKTSSGPREKVAFTENDEKILKLISEESVSGLAAGWDSSQAISNELPSSTASESTTDQVMENFQTEENSSILLEEDNKVPMCLKSSTSKTSSTPRVRKSRRRKKLQKQNSEDEKVCQLISAERTVGEELKKINTNITEQLKEFNDNFRRYNELKTLEIQIKAKKYDFEMC